MDPSSPPTAPDIDEFSDPPTASDPLAGLPLIPDEPPPPSPPPRSLPPSIVSSTSLPPPAESQPWVLWLRSHWIAIVIGLVAILLSFTLAGLLRGHPVGVTQGYGRLIHVAIEVQTRLKERRIEQVPIAIPYCHLAQGSNETAGWIQTQRRLNQEDTRLTAEADKQWRDHRCLPTFQDEQTFAHIDGTFETYISAGFGDVLRRAIYNTPNITTRLRPRSQEVFIDSSGHLYYRVLMPTPALGHDVLPQDTKAAATIAKSAQTRLTSVLVSHLELRSALNYWAHEVIHKINVFPTAACICPAHFGIVGSGLHFTTDETLCEPLGRTPTGPWHIWVDFHIDRVTEAAGKHLTSQTFKEGWHKFPALVDASLWPRDPAVLGESDGTLPMSVPEAVHYKGYDMEVLYQRDRVEQFDPRATDEHWATETADLFSHHDDTYMLRLTLDETRSLTSRSCKATTMDNIAFNACYGYCSMLDTRLVALSPV